MYISGYTDNAIAQKFLVDPGTVFLQKPFPLDTLARNVVRFWKGDFLAGNLLSPLIPSTDSPIVIFDFNPSHKCVKRCRGLLDAEFQGPKPPVFGRFSARLPSTPLPSHPFGTGRTGKPCPAD